MLAPTGTQLQAVVSGFVEQHANALGGITLSLLGDNGNRYYYAHLSAYEGVGGRVEQGAVIGYVGDTGNASGRSAPALRDPPELRCRREPDAIGEVGLF